MSVLSQFGTTEGDNHRVSDHPQCNVDSSTWYKCCEKESLVQ